MSDEPTHTRVLIGDGQNVRFDLGVPIRQLIAVKAGDCDPLGRSLAAARYRMEHMHIDIYPPLYKGEVVTAYFFSDYL